MVFISKIGDVLSIQFTFAKNSHVNVHKLYVNINDQFHVNICHVHHSLVIITGISVLNIAVTFQEVRCHEFGL